MTLRYKFIVYVPLTHADAVRDAIGVAGGGKIGNYSFCSFSTAGIGRFRPDAGANPHIGEVGNLVVVEEERIEVTVDAAIIRDVITAVKLAHPYEEVAYDVFPLEDL